MTLERTCVACPAVGHTRHRAPLKSRFPGPCGKTPPTARYLDWDGNNTEQLPEDLGGQLFGDDRIDRCSTVDMGAYEMHVACGSQ